MKRLMQFNPAVLEELWGHRDNKIMHSVDQGWDAKNTSSMNDTMWYFVIANDNKLEGL